MLLNLVVSSVTNLEFPNASFIRNLASGYIIRLELAMARVAY
jgi:hypothetical protein